MYLKKLPVEMLHFFNNSLKGRSFCNFKMDEFISTVPAAYQEIYRRHWNTIKTSVKIGILKDVYHFSIANYERPFHRLVNHLNTIREATNGRFKINVSFGFILKNRWTEELQFFNPSNNTLLFETPMLIANQNDCTNLLDSIEHHDVWEYARQQRPSRDWNVERVICMRFDVYRLNI